MKTQGVTARSVDLFRTTARCPLLERNSQGSYGKLFLGDLVVVYQAFVCAFINAASEASKDPSNYEAWEILLEENAGIDRPDLRIQKVGARTCVLDDEV